MQAINENLNAVGVSTILGDDFVTIFGKKDLQGGVTKGFNDHRIVMSMAVLATQTKQGIVVSDMQAINKSYPDFFDIYKLIGGQADVINMG